MSQYNIRKAIENDIPFLSKVVIAAEKGNSNILSLSTFFNLNEEQVNKFIISMFEEDVDGCEFSLSSYMVAELDNEPVAAFAGWIECLNAQIPSRILRSNLIGYTFNKESLEFLKTKAHLINEIIVQRDSMTLQLEYLFVLENHRNRNIASKLINRLIENAVVEFPMLQKAQVQLFSNNKNAYNLYKKNGFETVKTYKSYTIEILDYLPYNERIVMEKIIK